MEWLVFFIVSWVLFLILIDWKALKTNLFCGLLAIFIQLSVDTNLISHGLYSVKEPIISIFTSSAFFVFGPVFVIGTLIAQFHPRKKVFIVLNALIVAGIYTLQEINLIYSGALEYNNWHIVDSIMVNISAMVLLSWFSIVVLNKGGHIEH